LNQVKDWDLKKYYFIAINNAWKIRQEDWDYAIFGGGIVKHIMPKEYNPWQTILHRNCVKDIKPKYNENRSYLLVYVASYWALSNLNPRKIGFIGNDMDYSLNSGNVNSFYGNAIIDHKHDDPEYLNFHFGRLKDYADEDGVKLVNYSNNEKTVIPYPREEFHDKI